jgi:hypothetical protein
MVFRHLDNNRYGWMLISGISTPRQPTRSATVSWGLVFGLRILHHKRSGSYKIATKRLSLEWIFNMA